MTKGERIAESDDIARDRRDRNVKSVNRPFDFAQGRLRTRRNTKGFSRKCLASAFTLLTSSGFLSCRRGCSGSARNDKGGEDRRERRHRARSPGSERQKR